MTDLVFLLLIFFMLITTLIVPNINTLKLTLPNASTAKPTENLKVSVSINQNLEYFVNGKPVTLDVLPGSIQSALKGAPDPVIVLHTDNKVPIENVVKVMDIANRLRIKMVLATYPEK